MFKKLFGKNKGGAFLGGTLGSLAGGAPMGILGAAAGSKAKGSSLSDMLLGKKQKDINPDELAGQIRDTQSRGLSELNSALDQSGEGVVREQAEREKTSVLSAAQDARRNAQRLMAQRGLSGTSLGLNINRSIDQDTTRDIGTIDARLPGAIRNQKLQDAQTRIGLGGLNMGGINFNQIEGQRTGGIMGIAASLAPLAGQAAGAYKDYQTGQLASRRS